MSILKNYYRYCCVQISRYFNPNNFEKTATGFSELRPLFLIIKTN